MVVSRREAACQTDGHTPPTTLPHAEDARHRRGHPEEVSLLPLHGRRLRRQAPCAICSEGGYP